MKAGQLRGHACLASWMNLQGVWILICGLPWPAPPAWAAPPGQLARLAAATALPGAYGRHVAAAMRAARLSLAASLAAVETDGPVHFACNSRHPTGSTVLKRRLLRVRCVPRRWTALSTPAGCSMPPVSAPAPVPWPLPEECMPGPGHTLSAIVAASCQLGAARHIWVLQGTRVPGWLAGAPCAAWGCWPRGPQAQHLLQRHTKIRPDPSSPHPTPPPPPRHTPSATPCLQRLGWQPVDVPHHEWWGLAAHEQRAYMLRKLREAGLELPDTLPLEAEAAGARRGGPQQRRAPARQPRQQRRRRLEQLGQAAFADQLEGQLEASTPAALPSSAAGEQQRRQRRQRHQPTPAAEQPEQEGAQQAQRQMLPNGAASTVGEQQREQVLTTATADQQEEQQQQQQQRGSGDSTGQPGTGSGGASSGAGQAGEPTGSSSLAQRAQRLSILQYQRGKLSKQGLVARKGLQAVAGATSSGSGGGDTKGSPNGDGED